MLVGVDTGGTFTDVIAVDGLRLRLLKVPTTRPDPAPGVIAALERLALPAGFHFTHGTTVATNAVLERRGARTALVATAGFADLLVLARGQRPRLYALHPRRAEPLVCECAELPERIAADGTVVEPLDEAAVEAVAARLQQAGVESVALCLLFGYRNPAHERRAAEILRGAGLRVSVSGEVSPEFREYERASTTVLNAYLQPLMEGYLRELEEWSLDRGGHAFWVVHSAGAVMTAREAGERAVGTVLSGPAAGVQGAFHVASEAGFRQILTLDMGGTSTDVALCPGAIPYVTQGDLEGMPVRQLMIDVHTVGAGGGSLAYLDEAGALQVGPQSAGSDPGPAAYGRGERPTVTDAHVALGHLPLRLAGGEVRLDAGRARRALESLGGAAEEAAQAVLRVAATHMERALRVISVEKGWDPRRFTLVPYGGAGPLQAVELAEALEVSSVLVPPHPGVLCALGAVVSPWLREFSRTSLGGLQDMEDEFRELESQAPPGVKLERWVDLRYKGQGSELSLPMRGDLAAAFHRLHRKRFGYAREEFEIQRVALRVRARRARARLRLPRLAEGPWAEGVAARAWFGGECLDCQRFRREELPAGQVLAGPCIVDQLDSTTLIPPGWGGTVLPTGNLWLERRP